MTDKEAMKLALEGAANYIDALGGDSRKYRQALANEALDKMAENARELGLDYEPAQQEPVAWRWSESGGVRWFDWTTDWSHYERAKAMGFQIQYASPPAQRTWVGLTEDERGGILVTYCEAGLWQLAEAIEAKLRSKNEDRN